jgi:type IV pilus assembly protein PilN
MKITLNLATRPYADQGPAIRQLRIGMAVLAVLLLLLGWGLLHFHQSALRTQAQEDAVDRAIAKIQHEQQGYQAQMQQPANAKVLTQAQFLNQLFEEKSFSWTACMEDLEPVLPAGVQVTAIEPVRDKNGDLTLRLRIAGPRERSVEMLRNMEGSRRFVSPRIVGENAENSSAQGDLQPVSAASRVTFEVLAEYSQASLDERKAAIAAQKRQHPAASALPLAQASPRPIYHPPIPARMPGQVPGQVPGQIPGQPQALTPVQPGIPPGARTPMQRPGMSNPAQIQHNPAIFRELRQNNGQQPPQPIQNPGDPQ